MHLSSEHPFPWVPHSMYLGLSEIIPNLTTFDALSALLSIYMQFLADVVTDFFSAAPFAAYYTLLGT